MALQTILNNQNGDNSPELIIKAGSDNGNRFLLNQILGGFYGTPVIVGGNALNGLATEIVIGFIKNNSGTIPPNIALIDGVFDGQPYTGNVFTKTQITVLLDTELSGKLDKPINNTDAYVILGDGSTKLLSEINATELLSLANEITVINGQISNINNEITLLQTENEDQNDSIATLISELNLIKNWKASLTDADADNIVNTLTELLQAFQNVPEGSDLVTLLNAKTNVADIVNNLSSFATNVPLSANQGRVLNSLITALNTALSNEATARANGDTLILTEVNKLKEFSGKAITVTKTAFDNLIADEELIPNALYEITDVNTTLYGGTTIYLYAITNKVVNERGVGKFYNPKYDQSVAGFGIAVDYVFWADEAEQLDSGVYSVGDKVIWGGKHWECILPTNTTTKYIVDRYTLDSDYFEEIPYNETDYNVAYDEIVYDVANDLIVERNEANLNVVKFSKNYIDRLDDDMGDPIGLNPIKCFQWGNKYNALEFCGIGFQTIDHSFNENINYRGYSQSNVSITNLSYMKDITIYDFGQMDYIKIDNKSWQGKIVIDGNASQNNITITNTSYQTNIKISEINNSQSYIVLDNNSHIIAISLNGVSNNLKLSKSGIFKLNNLSFSDAKFENISINFNNVDYSGKRIKYLNVVGKDSNNRISIPNLNTATAIFNANLLKKLYVRPDGTLRLKYYDNTDNLVIGDITM